MGHSSQNLNKKFKKNQLTFAAKCGIINTESEVDNMIKYTKNGVSTMVTKEEMKKILLRCCKIRKIEKRKAFMNKITKNW